MSLRYLLDTNVVSEPALTNPSPELLKRLTAYASQSAIASPIWHELVYGVKKMPRGVRRTELEEYITKVVQRAFVILSYDEAAAAWHGSERARLEKLGRPAPFVDGQIAAIAYVNELELVTNNMKDFRRFKGLSVSSWH